MSDPKEPTIEELMLDLSLPDAADRAAREWSALVNITQQVNKLARGVAEEVVHQHVNVRTMLALEAIAGEMHESNELVRRIYADDLTPKTEKSSLVPAEGSPLITEPAP